MCDLVWSDPDDRCGWGISPRGAGYTFGQVSVFSSMCVRGLIHGALPSDDTVKGSGAVGGLANRLAYPSYSTT